MVCEIFPSFFLGRKTIKEEIDDRYRRVRTKRESRRIYRYTPSLFYLSIYTHHTLNQAFLPESKVTTKGYKQAGALTDIRNIRYEFHYYRFIQNLARRYAERTFTYVFTMRYDIKHLLSHDLPTRLMSAL